jgi:hypothetical protein
VTTEGARSVPMSHKYAMIIAVALDDEMRMPDIMSTQGDEISEVLPLRLARRSLGST